MYNQGPFASWVPKPVMLLLIFIIMLPMTAISGVYTSSAAETYGGLGAYSEFISLANNAGAIASGVAIAIIVRVKSRFRSKEIIAGCSIILAGLSYVCGTTDNPLVIVLCSFLISFFKMFPMMEMILPAMFILSPTGERGRFYSLFYPIILCFTQWSSYFIAKLVYNAGWESPYLLVSGVMLIVAVLSLIFQHNQRFSFKVPLYQVDWLSMALFAASLMCLNYALVFMRQQAWFDSPYIVGALVGGALLFTVLVLRQQMLKRPFIKFSVFKKANVQHGILLLLCMGVYLASSSIYSQYTIGVLGYTSLINAEVNLWMMPGIVISGIMAFFGFKNSWPLKYYILLGFVCFFIYTLILYLIIQPQMDIRYLEYSMVVKGIGMGTLFIGIWFYASLNLAMDEMLGMMAVLMPVRSFVGTAIGSALLSWAGYQAQWQSITDLSVFSDSSNPLSTTGYQSMMMNAVMNSGKIVLGSLCWFIIPVAILIIFHSYGNFNFRRLILFKKAIRGNSVKGYRL